MYSGICELCEYFDRNKSGLYNQGWMKTLILNYINLDKIGLFLSALCALHCVLTPIIILSIPMMARYYLGSPLFHLVMAIMIIPVGLAAFISGVRHHKNKRVLYYGVPGLLIIGLVPFLVHSLGLPLNEVLLMLLGSYLLIRAHWINRRACACSAHAH